MANYWESAFEALPDLVSLHTKDHQIIKANKALLNLLGKRPGEIIGKCFLELFDRDEPCENCPLEQSLLDGKSHTFENWSGDNCFLVTVGPIYEKGELIGFIHSVKDITYLKNVENKLASQISLQAKTEQRLNDIIESLPDLTFIIDEDGKYCEVYGRDNEHNLIKPINDLRHDYIKDILPDEKVKILMRGVNKTLKTNQPQIFTYCLNIKGKQCFFQARTSPLKELISGRKAIVWVAIDINEKIEKDLIIQELKNENKIKLGELLLISKIITSDQLDEALETKNKKIGEILMENGHLDQSTLNDALRTQLLINGETS